MHGAASAVCDPEEQRGRYEERRCVEPEEGADRHEGQEAGRRGPSSHRQRVRRRAHQAVRALDVVAVDQRGQEGAVGRIEIAGRGGEREGGDDQQPQRQVALQSQRGHRDEQDAAEQIRGDHRPPPVEPVGNEAAVEPEGECGDAVRQAHGQHAERAARDERVPHEGEILEGVAQLARGDREVDAAKVGASKEPREALRLHSPSFTHRPCW